MTKRAKLTPVQADRRPALAGYAGRRRAADLERAMKCASIIMLAVGAGLLALVAWASWGRR